MNRFISIAYGIMNSLLFVGILYIVSEIVRYKELEIALWNVWYDVEAWVWTVTR